MANEESEPIYRVSSDQLHSPPKPKLLRPANYPWDARYKGGLCKITKEFFRCRGSKQNPPIYLNDKETLFDCNGIEEHSLPIQQEKEFIYPILINLLNYIQSETKKQVIVTSGHRCPTHNRYLNCAPKAQYSKHQIGAEVTFYVEGMQDFPFEILKLIKQYYRSHPKFKDNPKFTQFLRYEKSDTGVAIKPWYNEEVYIKLFDPSEGRDLDQSHPYSYFSIQVRRDISTNTRVLYDWNTAHKTLLRK